MNIQLHYQTSPETLARASLIFLEQKWLMWLSIHFFNALALFLMVVLTLKLILMQHLTLQECGSFIIAVFWFFGRRPMTHKILTKRMTKDLAHTKGTQITLSKNGIAWGGQGIKQDSLKWNQIPRFFRTRNGYIIPARMTRFIWIPHAAFKGLSERKEFEKYAQDMNISIKRIKKSC